MKRLTVLLSLFTLPVLGQVSVEWITPTNGSVVSNIINLEVMASSTAGQIVKVEFYRDGILIATKHMPPKPVQEFRIWNLKYNLPPRRLTKPGFLVVSRH